MALFSYLGGMLKAKTIATSFSQMKLPVLCHDNPVAVALECPSCSASGPQSSYNFAQIMTINVLPSIVFEKCIANSPSLLTLPYVEWPQFNFSLLFKKGLSRGTEACKYEIKEGNKKVD